MEDEQGMEPARWERAGLVIGLIVALAIMWAVLGFALIAGDDGSNGTHVTYGQSDKQSSLDEDDGPIGSR
jgi:hypothetical protein